MEAATLSIKTILYIIITLYAAIGVGINFGAKYPDKMPFEWLLPIFGLLAILSLLQDSRKRKKRPAEEPESPQPEKK